MYLSALNILLLANKSTYVCFDMEICREDMEDSYGEAYATRSSDEGYGEAYGEAVKRYQTNPDIKEVQRGATSERDQKADAFAGK